MFPFKPTPSASEANKVSIPSILFLNSIEIQWPYVECMKLWLLYDLILTNDHIGAITCSSYIRTNIMDRLLHKTNHVASLHQKIWDMTKLGLIVLLKIIQWITSLYK
jgi:hypothetical protein